MRTCNVPSLTLDPLGQEVPDFDGEGVRRVEAVDGLVWQTRDYVRHVYPLSHDGGLHTHITQTQVNTTLAAYCAVTAKLWSLALKALDWSCDLKWQSLKERNNVMPQETIKLTLLVMWFSSWVFTGEVPSNLLAYSLVSSQVNSSANGRFQKHWQKNRNDKFLILRLWEKEKKKKRKRAQTSCWQSQISAALLMVHIYLRKKKMEQIIWCFLSSRAKFKQCCSTSEYFSHTSVSQTLGNMFQTDAVL